MIRWIASAATALLAVCGAAVAQELLPAERYVAPNRFWSASLSPDGAYVAAIQQIEQGEALVVIDWRTRAARAIQVARRDRSLYLDWVEWKTPDRLVFGLRQRVALVQRDATGSNLSQGADDQFDVTRVFAANRDGSNLVQMFEGQQRRLAADFAPTFFVDRLPQDPNNVLISTFAREGFALYRANVTTGRVEAIDDGTWNTVAWEVDGVGYPVLRQDMLPGNSGFRIFRRASGERRWTQAIEVRSSATADIPDFAAIAAAEGPSQVFVTARAPNSDRAAVYRYDTGTGAFGPPLYAHDVADVDEVWVEPNTRTFLAGCATLQRRLCVSTDPGMQRHLDALQSYFGEEAVVSPVDLSDDGQYWLLHAQSPTDPGGYYVYSRAETRVEALTPTQANPPPEGALSPTRVVSYRTRDGQDQWGYLTAPRGAQGALPLIVMPHGGPEARDYYGYDFLVQYLASRGYAVFQPNFRGSTGFGRAFAEAGYGQWGGRMQDDVTDGVRHLIEIGAVDAHRICAVGISYGGYAALMGGVQTPDLYRCIVSIAGVTDLEEILRDARSAEGRGSLRYDYDRRSIGDLTADRDRLQRTSPTQRAAEYVAPVLLIQGDEDDIVPMRQAELMESALRRAHKSVRLIRIEGGAHPWIDWDANQRAQTLVEVERFVTQSMAAAPN